MRRLVPLVLAFLAACPDDSVPGTAVDATPPPDVCPVAPERCNGLDDDCDGLVDEDFPDLGRECQLGVGACIAQGTLICGETGLICDAQPDAPTVEACGNAIDDDCDGSVDEDCACAPGEQRACGETVGACEAGLETCGADGEWQACEGAIGPAEETCNGLDDDCDGTVDELLVVDCTTDQPGACAAGTSTCANGEFGACLAIAAPIPETCNGVDDDCDGTIDEALTRTCGSDEGECVAGTQTCNAGGWGECLGDVGPSLDDCDGGDEDCDGVADDGCPAAVQLHHPWNGLSTGSARAASTAAVRKPLRPTFRWNPAAGATSYQLQVDDSCDPLAFRACAFASPERDLTATTVSHTLAQDLPVSLVAPVGRRYFWRVRACKGQQCSAWSEPRYLEVGRLPDDVNGDGYSDLLVGASRTDDGGNDRGRAYLYLGGPGDDLEATPDAVLPGEQDHALFGHALATVGDMDGDGFADFAVGAPFHDRPGQLNAGRVYLYRGAASLSSAPAAAFVLDGEAGDNLGSSLAAAGDADADGLADLLAGAPFHDRDEVRDTGQAVLYRGALAGAPLPTLLTGGERGAALGWSVAGAGDLNGDGVVDLLAGAPFRAADDAGAAAVYFGQPAPGEELAPVSVLPGGQAGSFYGWSLAGDMDLNGDGFADLAVGAYATDFTLPDSGAAYVYFGGPTDFVEAFEEAELTGSLLNSDNFGFALSEMGDHDGDGFDDLLVGEPFSDVGPGHTGDAHGYRGGAGASFDDVRDFPFGELLHFAAYGRAVSILRDMDGDGYSDAVIGAPGTPALYVYPGGPGIRQTTIYNPEGAADFAGALSALVLPLAEVLS